MEELTWSVVLLLVTRPFVVSKWACSFGLRTAFIFSITLTELLKAAIYLHFSLLWRMFVWTIALLTLPLRLVTAISRERRLEMQVRYMQNELENVGWERIKLEKHLQTAVKEHRMMELVLADLEVQLDKATAKIQILQDELKEVKTQYLRLLDVQAKEDTGPGHNSGFADKYGISYGFPKCKPSYDGSGMIRQDLTMLASTSGDESKASPELLKLLKPDLGSISRNLDTCEVLERRRKTAIIRSLFSAVLSLFVGMITWEAADPCMPLAAALFTVVGMSLMSAVQFFLTMKNKPASDAVALLSLNSFMLGTLSYPTFPRMARALAPLALRIAYRASRFVGLSFSLHSYYLLSL